MPSSAYEQALGDFCDQLVCYRLPRFQDLPALELYKDQVLSYLESILPPSLLQEPPLTAAMMHNYIKAGLLPPPVRKKYGQLHLAYLVAISFLKQIFSVKQMVEGRETLVDKNALAFAYNMFCDELESALRLCGVSIEQNKEEINYSMHVPLGSRGIKLAAFSIAAKLVSEKMLALQPLRLADKQNTSKKGALQ